MPRFYFDIIDGKGLVDDHGVDLPTLDAAKLEALRYMGELLRDEPELFHNSASCRVAIRTQAGGVVAQFFVATVAAEWLNDAVRPIADSRPPPVEIRQACALKL